MHTAPAGYSARRATIDDAQAIFDVQSAHNTPLIGVPNATLEDVTDELVEPDFALDTDGWLISDATGTAVGWGWACRKGDSDNVDISVFIHPGHDEVARWLWQRVQQRSVEIGRELGHPSVTVDKGVMRADEFIRSLAEDNGFQAAATFVRMRIDHETATSYPDTPTGVTLRHGTTDEQVRRDGLDVRNVAFSDHFGYVERKYEDWAAERETNSAHDWALLHVAYVDDEPAAILYRTNNFVPDENCGYVLTLGTLPAYQGKGLGSYLLRYAFASDAELGRAGTILHVDTNPDRPALGLYTRNGMRDILTIDIWRRTLSTAE